MSVSQPVCYSKPARKRVQQRVQRAYPPLIRSSYYASIVVRVPTACKTARTIGRSASRLARSPIASVEDGRLLGVTCRACDRHDFRPFCITIGGGKAERDAWCKISHRGSDRWAAKAGHFDSNAAQVVALLATLTDEASPGDDPVRDHAKRGSTLACDVDAEI